MARRRTSRRGGRNDIGRMSEDVKAAAVNALRNSAKEVLNGLGAESPNWGGEFRNQWYVETANGQRGVKARGEGGKYNLFNIPLLKIQGRDARGRFTSISPSNVGRIELLIGNSSPYAQEAMDLIPGDFAATEPPKGQIVARGTRQMRIRGNIKPGKGNNRSTAPLHWYDTHMGGGAFAAAFKRGARAGFIRPVN